MKDNSLFNFEIAKRNSKYYINNIHLSEELEENILYQYTIENANLKNYYNNIIKCFKVCIEYTDNKLIGYEIKEESIIYLINEIFKYIKELRNSQINCGQKLEIKKDNKGNKKVKVSIEKNRKYLDLLSLSSIDNLSVSMINFYDNDSNTLSNKLSCSNCDSSDYLQIDHELNDVFCANCNNKANEKKCYNCRKLSNKVVDYESCVGKIELCPKCINNQIFCGHCFTYNPSRLMQKEYIFAPSGKTVSHQLTCIKCCDTKNNLTLHNYHHYYDSSKYDTCPCLYMLDFKNKINVWNDDVLNYYTKDRESTELYGIELEVGSHVKNRPVYSDILNKVQNLVDGDAILKYDSSIDYLDGSKKQHPNDYRGFEIVTRPMTYKNSKKFLSDLVDNRPDELRSWQVGTTGVHIHVNKKYLSKLEIGKLLLFINNSKNRPFITFIAKRENKKYAKFLKRNILDYGDDSHNCHYYALNTSKPYTIEFRMFRGTLNKTTLLSYLQFVKSLIEFIKIHSISGKAPYVSTKLNGLSYKLYLSWLFSTNRSQYRELKYRIKHNEDFTFDEQDSSEI